MSDKNEFNRAAGAKAATIGGEEQTRPILSVKRPRRMTFREATQRTRLDVRLSEEDRKNFGYRWVNNDPGRIQELRDRGYEIVDNPQIDDERGTERRVGRNEDGSKQNARLMRIPREFMEEDNAEKRAMRQELLQSVASRDQGVTPEARREGIRAEQLSVTN
jgi:hypothetical protein